LAWRDLTGDLKKVSGMLMCLAAEMVRLDDGGDLVVEQGWVVSISET
jgi:hypothetical protein